MRHSSHRLLRSSAALVERSTVLVEECYADAVRLADAELVPWSEPFAAFVRVGSLRHGRDPAIEDAKSVLAHELGITRGDAFSVLHGLSQRQRRKLREIAREIAADASDRRQSTPPVDTGR